MFFSAISPVYARRCVAVPGQRAAYDGRAEAASTGRTRAVAITQDDTSTTLTFDMPGVSRDQLTIDIEAKVVRIQSVTDAPRSYKVAYELAQDIDATNSEAKLENGVLTVKLAKLVPPSRTTKIAVH